MLLRGNHFYAPSGTAADATEEGELTDEEFAAGVDTEPAADPVEEVATEPVAESPPVKSWKDYGLDDNPETVAREVARLRQAEQKAQAYEQMLWQQAQRQQLAEQRVPQPEVQKPKFPWGEAPEFSQEWVNLVERDEHGNLVAKPGAMPDLPQKISAYAKWREQAQDQFLRDPIGVLRDHINPIVQEQARQIAEQMFRENEEKRSLADYEAANRDLYFVPGTNQLNDLGNYFNQQYTQAKQAGYTNPLALAVDAVDAVLARTQWAQQSQAPVPTPAQANADKKVELLKKQANGANRIANRTGTFPKNNGHNSPPQNSKAVWEEARRKLHEIGEDGIKFGDE